MERLSAERSPCLLVQISLRPLGHGSAWLFSSTAHKTSSAQVGASRCPPPHPLNICIYFILPLDGFLFHLPHCIIAVPPTSSPPTLTL